MPKKNARSVKRSTTARRGIAKREVKRRRPGSGSKALFRRYIGALLSYPAKDPKALDEVLAPTFVAHDLPSGMDLRSWRRIVNTAFPDQEVEIAELIAEKDLVAARLNLTQTHLGAFQGIPPTGKRVSAEFIEIDRVKNGKIAERWVQWDRQGVLQKLREPSMTEARPGEATHESEVVSPPAEETKQPSR